MNSILEGIREGVRGIMNGFAKLINTLTGGKLHPNVITITSFLMHIPIGYFIYRGDFLVAGLLLIVFGLFDALDGALARLQNRSSHFGMFLDSLTDRLKEVIIYVGIGAYLSTIANSDLMVWSIAALGISIIISYTNAWGEVIVTRAGISTKQTNKTFRGGIMSFDVRMFLLVVGLLFDVLPAIIVIITIFGVITIIERTIIVANKVRKK